MGKTKFLLIAAMLCSMTLTSNAWWWNSDDDDDQQQVEEQQKQEITRLQGEVDQQEHSKDEWQIIAFVLGVGCCGCLICGAALGSAARKAAEAKP